MSRKVGPPATWTTAVEVDGRAYVFVPTTGALLALDESATRVWRLCDGTRDRDEVAAELVSTHGGTPVEVAVVLEHALRMFTDAGLLSAPAPRD